MAAHATVKFLRLNTWPEGTRFHVLWNGQIDATTGDGKPPANVADPVDEANPLTPAPVEVWPYGKAGHGLEPVGLGMFGMPSNYGVGLGDEVFGDGELGLFNDYVRWSTREVLPTLRDGQYKFAIRFEDEHGTLQADALVVGSITVSGTPRPPRRLRFVEWDDVNGEVVAAWDHSLDLL